MPSKHKNKTYARQYSLYRITRLKQRAIERLGGKCKICGYDKCLAALGFHHRDPSEKEFTWDHIRTNAWDIIVKEIDKCDLLCCNCHMEYHWNENAFKEAGEAVKEAQKRRWFRLPNRNCQRCGKNFKPQTSSQIYCSIRCSSNRGPHIEWPIDLSEMIKNSSVAAVARQLGVSSISVRVRLIKYHGFDPKFSTKKYKIQWPDNLPAYISGRSISSVARELGVSDKSIVDRLRRHYGKV